ncbi:MAG: hypothetical protein COA57_09285 [Flavobacteriales bacterium]|nr:MAG: hypothetical protein COA57_09285 [Flavobacteriales bacterium]
MRKLFLLAFCAIFIMPDAIGQLKFATAPNQQPTSNGLQKGNATVSPSQHWCGQNTHEDYLRLNDPLYDQKKAQAELQLQKAITKSQQNQSKTPPPVYTIPTVVHVVYRTATENLTDAQVITMIADLTADFRRTNSDASNTPAAFLGVAADMEIEFCLAQVDPSGNATNGIERRQTTVTSFTTNDAVKFFSSGGLDSWNVNDYFNIWLCNLGGGLLGYGEFPTGTPSNTYGAVSHYCTAKGTCPPYNLNRTTTHEMSHCFNLRHIWGDDGGSCAGSDLVGDTPNQADNTFGCPSYPTTDGCSPSSPGIMFMNYMDYSNDACMNMFTEGQKTRARNAITAYYPSLITSTKCTPPNSPPTCNFSASPSTITEGGTIDFTDLSAGLPTSWDWTFQSGSPGTSTTQNPSGIVYNTAGTYNVTLIATNAFGTCTLTQSITVIPNVGCDTLNNPPPGTIVSYQGGNGYVCGWNTTYQDVSKANYFDSYSPYTHVTGGLFNIRSAYDDGNGASVDFSIWDNSGTGGEPGTVIASVNVPLITLAAIVPTGIGAIVEVLYPSPIQVTGPYYMGVQMNGFGSGDSLGLRSNFDGDSNPNLAWEEWGAGFGGGWYAFDDASSWGLSISIYVSPYMTDIPPTATATSSGTSGCEGTALNFDGTSSVNASSYDWDFPGGTPGSSVNSTASITYNTSGTYTAYLTVNSACQSRDVDSITNITIYPTPSVTITTNNVTCNGALDGTTTANPSGGTSPYSYSWSDPGSQTTQTATGLGPGTYFVTVTDNNGCEGIQSTNISQPSPITTTTTTTDANCGANDGTATASATGGAGSYTFVWDNGQTSTTATGLAAGTYTVTATDANGCTQTATATVNNVGGGGFTATVSAIDLACNGDNNGMATSAPSGGSTPYTYQWGSNAGNQSTQTATGLSAGIYYVTITDATSCSVIESDTISEPSAISINTSSTDETCGSADGTASVNASGGTSPYNYNWSDGQTTQTATGLSQSTISCTITDANNCTQTANATINNISGPSASASSTDITCNGNNDGTATANASGGTSPYIYNWSSGGTSATENNLTQGTYTVTITDDNGCTATSSVTINEPSALGSSASATDANCNGDSDGSATASATGGVTSYSYLWNDGQTNATATGLTANTYNVTITDASGCTSTASATVNEPAGISISISSINDATCGANDGSATVNASGGTGSFTYQWDDTNNQTGASATGLAAGSYTVTATDANSCTNTAAVSISNLGAPSITTNQINSTCTGICDGVATVSVTSGSSPYTYQWDDSNNQTASTASGLCAGTYNVSVTDVNGCLSATSVIISAPTISSNTSGTDPTAIGSCDGSVSASPSGGATPYSYQWDDTGNSTTSSVNSLCDGTYCVTITDANNCSNTDCVTIIEPSCSMSATVTTTNADCGNKDGTATVNVSGGNSPFTYTWDDGQTSQTASSLDPGTYDVTVTDGIGCLQILTATVNGGPALTGNTQSTFASCGSADGTTTINVLSGTSPYTYQWDAATGNQTTATATGLTAGGPYNVTVTDATGCTVNESVTVSAIGGPNLSSSSTTDEVCGNSNGTASVVATSGTTPYIYQWDDANNQTTATATGLTAGTYSVTIADSIGCTYVASLIVDASSGVSLIISSNAEQCGQGDGTATATPTGGSLPYTYLWDNSQTTQTATGLSAGTYNITVTDNNGCQESSSVIVSGSGDVNGNVTSTNTSCGTSNGTATVSVISGTPSYTYQWSDVNNQSTSTATGLSAGNYLVTVTDANGCTYVDSATVSTSSGMSVNIATTVEQCGANDGAAVITPSGGTSPYTYLWDANAGSQTTQTVTGLAAGTYNVTVTDAAGCEIFAAASIGSSGSNMSVSSSLSPASCGSANGVAVMNISGGTSPYSYQWDDPNSQTSSIATGLSSGTYNVTITDNAGCVETATISIDEESGMTITTTTSNANCGTSDGLANINVQNGTTPYTYQWNDPNSQTSSTATGLAAGSYTCIVTDAAACTDTIQISITTSSGLTINSSSSANELCNAGNGSASVTASGGPSPYTYLWNDFDAQTTATATGLSQGSYTVTVTDSSGCPITAQFAITNSDGNFETQTAATTENCGSGDGTATAGTSGGTAPFTYLWSNGQTDQIATGLSAGTFFVTVIDSIGCAEEDLVLVGNNGPSITYSVIDVSCEGLADGSIDLNVSGGIIPYIISWSNDENTEDVENITADEYTVVVTDANNCSVSDDITVNNGPEFCINIPSGFTPNNDGTNDKWVLRGIETFSSATIEVYNRWGTLLFSSTNYVNEPWDGTRNGNELPAAAYYYVIKLNDNTSYTGTITIIR